MRDTDYEQFASMLNAVAELHGKTLSGMTIAMWWNSLKGHDLSAIQEGFSRHVQNPDNGQFMPKPADVIRMLGGTTQDSALVAWSFVSKSVSEIGTYRSVVFDDPIIHAVIQDMGGWIKLGTKTNDDWPFVAKEFENRYRGYKTKGDLKDFPKKLTGIADSNNLRNGFGEDVPVLIGDEGKAMEVFRLGNDGSSLKITQMKPQIPANQARITA